MTYYANAGRNEHIPAVLDAIQAIWAQYPDKRLGRLLMEAFPLGQRPPHVPSLYDISDDGLIARLREVHTPSAEQRAAQLKERILGYNPNEHDPTTLLSEAYNLLDELTKERK